VFEPGRFLTANAGVLLARVLYLKEEAGRRFLVIDAAMNDLARPALYDAYHGILPLREAAGAALAPTDVVGPVCETGDILAKDRPLPPLNPGDAIAILSAGAYGAAMASTYNSRLLVAETMVNGADYAIVRPRQTFDAALALDRVPQWFHRSSSARARGVSG
jgi:diaminopimelate decarboxylase